MFSSLLDGFSQFSNLWLIVFCFAGTFMGTLVGTLPGVGPAAAIAVLIPLLYGVDPLTALVVLAGIYHGAMYGGSITSILLNVPGDAAAVVITYDGHPLAKQGRGGVALGISAISSFIAETISVIMLTALAIPVARLALVFGPTEYFAIMLLAFVMVSSLARGNMIKSFVSLFLGLLLSTVGQDVISGSQRLTWHSMDLIDGIGFLPAVIGLFGFAEILYESFHPRSEESRVVPRIKISEIFPKMADFKLAWRSILRGQLLGFFTGVFPGGGATIATFLAYGMEKRISKTPERFGTGAIEGVAGPESAANGASFGTFVPLLSLGIPGSATTAVLMGAFIILGVQPGPRLFTDHPHLVWGLIASMYIGNLMLLAQNIFLVPAIIRMFTVAQKVIPVVVSSLCVYGIYSIDNSMWNVWLMLIFAVLGYGFRLAQIPAAPLVVALVLGNNAEYALRQALVISQGSPLIFFESPISLCLLLIAAFCLVYPMLKARRNARRSVAT